MAAHKKSHEEGHVDHEAYEDHEFNLTTEPRSAVSIEDEALPLGFVSSILDLFEELPSTQFDLEREL